MPKARALEPPRARLTSHSAHLPPSRSGSRGSAKATEPSRFAREGCWRIVPAATVSMPSAKVCARWMAAATGVVMTRKEAKIINFGILYGMGVGKLAEALQIDVAKATGLRDAVRRASPGVLALDRELKRRAREGEPLRTWGSRIYYCEPPDEDGRSFDYKMLNTLVQGSAADATKEAIVRYDAARKHGRLLVSVHDEIGISCPSKHFKTEMKILKDVMESIEFDVVQLTEGSCGPSWGQLKECE